MTTVTVEIPDFLHSSAKHTAVLLGEDCNISSEESQKTIRRSLAVGRDVELRARTSESGSELSSIDEFDMTAKQFGEKDGQIVVDTGNVLEGILLRMVAMEAKNEELDARVVDQGQKNEELDARVVDQEQKNEELGKRLVYQEQKNIELGKRVVYQEQKNIELTKHVVELKNENVDLKRENIELDKRVANREVESEEFCKIAKRSVVDHAHEVIQKALGGKAANETWRAYFGRTVRQNPGWFTWGLQS